MADKALIILAHPARKSLSRLFADDAKRALVAAGSEVTLIDLYAENFDPSLTEAERAGYYSQTPENSAITGHAAMLMAASTLVLVFPTWWFGLPAILKGWIDRTFAPGMAFDHARDFGPITPRLTNLKRVVVITTLGSPAWIDWLIMRRPVRRILKTAIFGLCAPKAKFQMLSLYRAEKTKRGQLDAFRRRIRRTMPGLVSSALQHV